MSGFEEPPSASSRRHMNKWASSGGGSHPSALLEPDVRLSPHPAPTLQPSAAPNGCASGTGSSHRWLADVFGWRARSLRSTRITRLHRYYGTHPPLCPASVLGSLRVCRLEVSLGIGAQVPTFRTRASRWSHAVSMPVAARPVGRLPPSFVPDQQWEPGFGDVCTVSTPRQRFTRVRLTSAHLTGDSRLFRNAHHQGHCAPAACGGLGPDPAIRARGASPHLLCSKAARSRLR